ncbi:formate dehydrogenase accessory protein FdhE [Halodesulfovibrio sp.]|jgi:FdhE protein|uniref:formate dehydrogenase accessory protein FdhE n=1 Tax=Halodesulfovibrio sp. TaxID=1912772 RepID=UPI0025F79259|nr:formate dehydrogenase accessory protein FdhE [Halodesulfovibrio sp.]MCT4626217.1 formate dehydrogenase accessory protein FdhE [Halodesulfovibrio sp.]
MEFNLELETKRLERKLTHIAEKGFLPQELLQIVSNTAVLQLASRANVTVQPLQPQVTSGMHIQGAPLVNRAAFAYDPKETAILFGKMLAMLDKAEEPLASSATKIRKAIEDKELSIQEACDAFISDDNMFFADWAARIPESPSLVRFLAQGSVTPSLQAQTELLKEHRSDEEPWPYGHCPHCGSQPLIASLKEKEGLKYLTCSFCRLEYRAKRLQCAFCGEEDHNKLEYFKADGEAGYEVHVCKTCSCYIKISDFREFDRVSIPVLDDLESLTLDILARKQGYARPTLSAWGF